MRTILSEVQVKPLHLPKSGKLRGSNRAILRPQLIAIEEDGWKLATFWELLITIIVSEDLGLSSSQGFHFRQHSTNSSAFREMAWRQPIFACARSALLPEPLTSN